MSKLDMVRFKHPYIPEKDIRLTYLDAPIEFVKSEIARMESEEYVIIDHYHTKIKLPYKYRALPWFISGVITGLSCVGGILIGVYNLGG